MFKAGQKVKNRRGHTVQILAVLDEPDSSGFSIIGLVTAFGNRELCSWTPSGHYMADGSKCDSDLERAPFIETKEVFGHPDPEYNFIAWYSDDDTQMVWGPTEGEAVARLMDTYVREVEAA